MKSEKHIKLLSEIYKGVSDRLILKNYCNLCNVQVKNSKRHCKSQKHSYKIQIEFIKIRRDSMYCNEWYLYINKINNMNYLENKTTIHQNDFIRTYMCTYNGIQKAIGRT